MNRKVFGVLTCFLVLAALTTGVLASGFEVYEQGSAASGQAGAFVAQADDPTALFYNPAGIAYLEGHQVHFNGTFILPDVKFQSPLYGQYKNTQDFFFVPSLYYTWRINDSVAFGLGTWSNWNLSTEWDNLFPARFASKRAKMNTLTISPSLAWRINENNALALSLRWNRTKINLDRAQDTTLFSYLNNFPSLVVSEGMVETDLDDTSLGWGLSYLGRWNEWSFGFRYNSKASMNLDGTTHFTMPTSIGAFALLFPRESTSTQLDLPQNLAIGFGYASERWGMNFDITWTDYSVWDQADVHFDNWTYFSFPPFIPKTPAVMDETLVFDWKDSFVYRLGFHYNLNNEWALRWGLIYDRAPVPDQTRSPVLPDTDRLSYTFGAGYKSETWSFNTYIMYLDFKTGDIPATNLYNYNNNGLFTYPMQLGGQYKGDAWLGGFDFTFKF